MPSIKFTALVSDMKGKANGSVFSKNKQGNYFRNNVTGGGRKSLAWDQQKSNFSFLSTQWRSLTEVQKDSWASMAANYPALNKFKESYIPSAYQLYMRLNGVLYAKGFTLLTTPIAQRSLPNLDDLYLDMPTLSAYTGRWGAGFNNPSAINVVGNQAYCPQCYVQGGFDCQIGMPELDFLNCFNNLQLNRQLGCSTGCTTSADCETQGMSAPNNEVCCQDGVCNWCGDGVVNMYQGAYLLNIAPGLKDGGVLTSAIDDSYVTFTLSFRLWLDTNAINGVRTNNVPVVIVSNYSSNGNNLWIRICPNDATSAQVEFGLGLYDSDRAPGLYTNAMIGIVPYVLLENLSNVWLFQYNMNSKNDFVGLIGMSSDIAWIPYSTEQRIHLSLYYNWAVDGTHNWATVGWETTAQDWGIMLGAFSYARQWGMNFSDFRFQIGTYTEDEQMFITQGYIMPYTNVICAMAFTNVQDCCNKVCSSVSPCSWQCNSGADTGSCVCADEGAPGGGMCLTSNVRGLANFGSLATEIPSFQFVCPAYDFIDSANGDYGLVYNGNCLPYGTYPTMQNNAIFAPSVTINVPPVAEDNFFLIVNASKPMTNNSVNSTTSYIGSIRLGVERAINICDWLISEIGNFPDNSTSNYKLQILDSESGQLVNFETQYLDRANEMMLKEVDDNGNKKKKKPKSGGVRFKAGSDLSSSVN